jgi:hypothetical protein
MSLDDLSSEIESTSANLGDELPVALDAETRTELAMLTTALGPDEPDEIVRRAVHLLFQRTVETGQLDFHLRAGFDVTYDEYLSGMTYEDMTGGYQPPSDGNERRYQF